MQNSENNLTSLNNLAMLTNLGIKPSWMKRNQVYSKEGSHPSPELVRADSKNTLVVVKIFVSDTACKFKLT